MRHHQFVQREIRHDHVCGLWILGHDWNEHAVFQLVPCTKRGFCVGNASISSDLLPRLTSSACWVAKADVHVWAFDCTTPLCSSIQFLDATLKLRLIQRWVANELSVRETHDGMRNENRKSSCVSSAALKVWSRSSSFMRVDDGRMVCKTRGFRVVLYQSWHEMTSSTNSHDPRSLRCLAAS